MKNILILVFVLFFIGCGVDTDSSSRSSASTSTDTGSDTNTNDSDNNSSSDSGSSSTVDTSGDNFDRTDAELDANACLANSVFNVFSDSHFDPIATADNENGIELSSTYTGDFDVQDSAKIRIYYPDLQEEKIGTYVNVYVGGDYRFGYDKAWLTNENRTIYIKTPVQQDQSTSCYKFNLNSVDASSISGIKVYR